MKKSSGFVLGCACAGLVVSACTNAPTTAGNVSRFYDGTVTGIEVVTMNTDQFNTTTAAATGAVLGAVIGNLINRHSEGTVAGAAVGASVGTLGAQAANYREGLRLTIDSGTSSGSYIVDVPFSCKCQLNSRVRVITSGTTGAQVQVLLENGTYQTLEQQSTLDCPELYETYKQGVYAASSVQPQPAAVQQPVQTEAVQQPVQTVQPEAVQQPVQTVQQPVEEAVQPQAVQP